MEEIFHGGQHQVSIDDQDAGQQEITGNFFEGDVDIQFFQHVFAGLFLCQHGKDSQHDGRQNREDPHKPKVDIGGKVQRQEML